MDMENDFEHYLIFHRGIQQVYVDPPTTSTDSHLHVVYQDGYNQDLGNPYGQYVNTAIAAANKSERYAVGQENGHNVASGTVGYQNNSKYWADQAERWARNKSTASGQTGYQNNAEFWANDAANSALDASQSATLASGSMTACAGSEESASLSASAAASSAANAANAVDTAISNMWGVKKDANVSPNKYYINSPDFIPYRECTTAASEQTKTVSRPAAFHVAKGAQILVHFANTNTAASPKLALTYESTTQTYSIYLKGVNGSANSALTAENAHLLSGLCQFVFDGSFCYLVSSSYAIPRKVTYTNNIVPPSNPCVGDIWLVDKAVASNEYLSPEIPEEPSP